MKAVRARYLRKINLLKAQLADIEQHAAKKHGCGIFCRVVDIEPIEFPVFSTLPKTKAGDVHEWVVDTLAPVEYKVGWWWRVPYGWWLALKKWWAAKPTPAETEAERLLRE